MGKFIEVYDDVISPKIQDVVEDFLLGKNLKNKIEGIPWTYVPNVSDQGNNSINELGFAENNMALTKQSLRKGVHVLVNDKLATKEELIEMSQEWSEKREVFFRKMLQQGGKFKFDGIQFDIRIRERILNSIFGWKLLSLGEFSLYKYLELF